MPMVALSPRAVNPSLSVYEWSVNAFVAPVDDSSAMVLHYYKVQN